jgi:tRNA(Ile2) C34 agmatinyltransferase TiaS
MVFVHVDGDVVNGMAAYQPVVPVCVLCGGRMKTASTEYTYRHNRLICRHTIDYVTIDVHKKPYVYSFNQALGDSLMMVPT